MRVCRAEAAACCFTRGIDNAGAGISQRHRPLGVVDKSLLNIQRRVNTCINADRQRHGNGIEFDEGQVRVAIGCNRAFLNGHSRSEGTRTLVVHGGGEVCSGHLFVDIDHQHIGQRIITIGTGSHRIDAQIIVGRTVVGRGKDHHAANCAVSEREDRRLAARAVLCAVECRCIGIVHHQHADVVIRGSRTDRADSEIVKGTRRHDCGCGVAVGNAIQFDTGQAVIGGEVHIFHRTAVNDGQVIRIPACGAGADAIIQRQADFGRYRHAISKIQFLAV